MRIYLVNPSDVAFGVGVITPRWLYVLAAATPAQYGNPVIVDEHTVLPVNSDQIDKLEFVTHPSIAVRALIHRAHRLTCRLVSEPCGTPVGGSRPATPDRSPAALREAPEADARGSTLVGMVVCGLAGLEVGGLHHASRYRRGLAPQGLSLVLDLEDSTREAWTTERAETSARLDSNDEPRKPALGSSTHSWRVAQTRHRDRRNQRR